MGTWFGNGKNIYSWVHIDDLVSSIIFLIENNCKGVYNLVAPNPVTSKQFTLTISKILGKNNFYLSEKIITDHLFSLIETHLMVPLF